jgi:hypothetical protein
VGGRKSEQHVAKPLFLIQPKIQKPIESYNPKLIFFPQKTHMDLDKIIEKQK